MAISLWRWLFGPNYKYRLVFGSSFASVSEAVQEAQIKVDALANAGWEAISVGVGGRAAGGIEGTPEGGGGQAVDVVVLMRG